MSGYGELKKTIEKIAGEVFKAATPTKKVHARLIGLDPLKFQLSEKIFIYGPALISPKYRVFTNKDIGNSFVFQEDQNGQQYIYLYEAAAPGENGIAYNWSGEIKTANLIGTCPHGAVQVTHGKIQMAEHTKGEN